MARIENGGSARRSGRSGRRSLYDEQPYHPARLLREYFAAQEQEAAQAAAAGAITPPGPKPPRYPPRGQEARLMRELGDEYAFSGDPDMPQELVDAYLGREPEPTNYPPPG